MIKPKLPLVGGLAVNPYRQPMMANGEFNTKQGENHMDYTQFDGHTPGPWRFEECASHGGGWGIQVLGPRSGISSVVVADMPLTFKNLPEPGHAAWERQKVNAALIAAAPYLLAENVELRAALRIALAGSREVDELDRQNDEDDWEIHVSSETYNRLCRIAGME